MTENAVEAGRLYVEVLSDTTGFRRDLRAKLDASTRNLRAKIRAELDTKGINAQAREAVEKLKRGNKAKLDVQFDRAQIRKELAVKLAQATRGVKAKVELDVDDAKARQALARALRQNKLPIDADTAPAERQTERFRRDQESRSVGVRMHVDRSSLTAVSALLGSLSRFPAVASGIMLAAGAVANLGGALFAVTASASQAVGVLAAIPGLAATAIQGVGALALAFSGVGDAIKAMGKANQAAGASAGRAARVHSNAADQIRAARQRIADAYRQSARQVADAERSLSDAQRAQQRAQQDLTQARVEAREELQQLAFDARGAALAEESAEIALEHAKNRVIQARQSAAISPLDRRQAELDYRQAVLDLEEARDRAADLGEENRRAAKAGVDGSERVRDARENLADANRGVADAERNLADAHRDGARAVADAQRALAAAMRSSTPAIAGTSAATGNLNTALANLSPAARRFAEFVVGTLLPRFKRLRFAVQEAFFPPFQRGVKAALPLLDTLQTGLTRSAGILGRVGERLGKMAGSAPFRRDTATILASNNKALEGFGNASVYLVSALRHVMVAASPLVERIGALAEKWAKNADAAAEAGRENGKLAAFFDRAWDTGKQLFGIVEDLTAALYNLGKASRPSGDTLLDSLARGTKNLREWTEDPANQKRIQDFFENSVPVMEEFARLLGRIVGLFLRFGEATGGGTLRGLFGVLETFVSILERIASLPGGGSILTTIFTLAGAGVGLSLVARAMGGIVGSLTRLSRLSGVSKILDLLMGSRRRGKSPVKQLGDDVDGLTTSIDKELPKDKRKTRAVGDVGDAAKKTTKPTTELGAAVGKAGDKADEAAKKGGRFSRILSGIGRVAGRVGAGLAGIALAIPGLSGLARRRPSRPTAPARAGQPLPHPGDKKVAGRYVPPLPAEAAQRAAKPRAPGRTRAAARKVGRVGGVAGIIASLFGPEIEGAITGKSRPGSGRAVAGGAVGGAITGGGIGSLFGPIGAGAGSLFGGGLGAVRGAGGNVRKGALFGLAGGLPGIALGGLMDKTAPAVKRGLGRAGGTIRRTAGRVLRSGPEIAADAVTAIPHAISRAAAKTPDAFLWMAKQAKALPGRILKSLGDLGGKIKRFFTRFRFPDVFKSLKQRASRIGRDILRTLDRAWDRVSTGVKNGLGRAAKRVSQRLGEIRKNFSTAGSRLRKIWSDAMASVRRTAARYMDRAKNKISETLGAARKSFSRAISSIKTTWAKLQAITKKPVKFLVDTVYTGGIRRVWEAVRKLVPSLSPLPTVKFARGGVMPGYTPGRDVHQFFSPTGGRLDLSGGEIVFRPEVLGALGKQAVDYINRKARGGVRAAREALGDVLGGGPHLGGFAGGGILDRIKSILRKPLNFARHVGGTLLDKGADVFAKGILDPILKRVGGAAGGGLWGQAFKSIPKQAINGFLSFVKKVIAPNLVGGSTAVVRAARSQLGLPYSWGGGGRGGPSYGIGRGAHTRGFDCSGLTEFAWWRGAKVGIGGVTGPQHANSTPISGPRPGALAFPHLGHVMLGSDKPGKVIQAPHTGAFVEEVRRSARDWRWPRGARKAAGGVIGLDELFNGDPSKASSPLAQLMRHLSHRAAGLVAKAIGQARELNRDSGGPIPPGRSLIDNATGRWEWALSPEAIDLLGGTRSVAGLTSSAARLHRASRRGTAPHKVGAAAAVRDRVDATVNVYPQPRQTEYEIGVTAARKLGAMLP